MAGDIMQSICLVRITGYVTIVQATGDEIADFTYRDRTMNMRTSSNISHITYGS
jgi:hypothetical protein